MNPEKVQQIARALADHRRREILEIIADASSDEGIHCNAIVRKVSVSQPTVSHHIKELVAADLVEIHPEGTFNRLTLRTETMQEYLDSLRTAFHLPPPKNA